MNTKMKVSISILIAASVVALTGCGDKKEAASPTPTPTTAGTTQPTSSPNGGGQVSATPTSQATNTPAASIKPGASPSGKPAATPTPAGTKGDAVQVVANPASVTVLVNKQNALPSSYEPNDLVYPNVPFTFNEKIEKRKMRQVAATAIEKLFAGAEKDGIHLAGVSAYRSYATQKSVFERYVSMDGEEKAKTYSAVPGTSEHETGLAIDVTGSNGKCAAEDCFGGTKEAVWLEKHAYEYGFIIRYPKGKEAITGYQYEPWHIRYVGNDIAKEIQTKNVTLEEYFRTVPVAK
ncbi:M15 family metallopeptidase [Paenibacillus whitsoniae]|uniref:D-alanyl-D-alanine carboxypeptidase family protein n=1 Tax=Paenibacillus whitsoniae TaxID=2496558 RepID=A0A430JEB0_9BACL|nr:M15 family metallopeptidase [Paenibacillus whitsoniae]RTE09324.1 D-alanyl-D-alanine carboxypeptidase family protein [Paenibacillus whitsoniae]